MRDSRAACIAARRRSRRRRGAESLQAYALAPLRDGRSSTLIAAPIAKLASGNYGVVIRSQVKPQNLFACGQLYRT